jgi:hypothetical protein
MTVPNWQDGDDLYATDLLGAFSGKVDWSFVAAGASQTQDLRERLAASASIFDFVDKTTLDLTGGTDNTAQLQPGVVAAATAGVRYLYFPGYIFNAPGLVSAGQVIFVGPGKLTGAYRKRIIPVHAGTKTVSGDVSPSRHLKNLNAAVKAGQSVTWIRLGDSTTESGSPLDASVDTSQANITRRLQEEFGADYAKITVLNFGVGGQKWSDMNSGTVGTSCPAYGESWYTDLTKTWLQTALSAVNTSSAVFEFNFGQNDGSNFDLTQPRAVMAAIKSWATANSIACDYLFTCSYVPTNNLNIDSMRGAQAWQEGVDGAAGWARTYAEANGYGYFDWNRQATLLRDGFDIRDQALTALTVSGSPAAMPYSFPQATYDFSANIAIASLNTVLATGDLPITLSPNPNNVVLIGRDGTTGNLTYQVNAGLGVTAIARTVSAVASGGGTQNIGIAVRGARLTLRQGGTVFADVLVERQGGLFTPVIGAAGFSSFTLTPNRLCVSVPQLYVPQLLDSEMFGGSGAGGITGVALPTGGNGINHLSSVGINRVMRAVYAASRLAA